MSEVLQQINQTKKKAPNERQLDKEHKKIIHGHIIAWQKGIVNMKDTGIIRKIDELGRIVLPMELRRAYKLEAGTPIEMHVDKDSIVLKKYVSTRTCSACGAEQKDNNMRVLNKVALCDLCIEKLKNM